MNGNCGSQNNVYIGARYVPRILGEWSADMTYEPLDVVLYQGTSYTSRTYVPKGIIPSENTQQYWALTGNYNAQVEMYRQEVENLRQNLESITPYINKTYNTTIDIIDDYNLKKNTIVNSKGYHKINDQGGANYYVTDIQDNTFFQIKTSNDLYLTVIDNIITPQMVGCYGDGINNDTAYLQLYFNTFKLKKYKLCSYSGIYAINMPVYVIGNYSNEQELYSIEFYNSLIKYNGINRYALYFYGHRNSKIKGISLSQDSTGYIAISDIWYSEFIDMQCKQIVANADINSIVNYPNNLDKSINTIKFGDCRIKNIVFNNTNYTNSINFNNCLIGSTDYEYCVEFNGETYNNISFNNCDLSYATISVVKLSDNPNGSITFFECYFDSIIPIVNVNNWIINKISCYEASGATDNLLSMESFSKDKFIGNKGYSANIENNGIINYMNNGNFWNLKENYAFTKGSKTQQSYIEENTMNGYAMKLDIVSGGSANYFYGQKSLYSGNYTGYIIFKILEMNEDTSINIGLNGSYTTSSLQNLDINSTYIFTSRSVNVSANTSLTLELNLLKNLQNVSICILEIGVVFGNNVNINGKLINPLLKYSSTANRPTPTSKMIGFKLFDTDLNKMIIWNGTKWLYSDGTNA